MFKHIEKIPNVWYAAEYGWNLFRWTEIIPQDAIWDFWICLSGFKRFNHMLLLNGNLNVWLTLVRFARRSRNHTQNWSHHLEVIHIRIILQVMMHVVCVCVCFWGLHHLNKIALPGIYLQAVVKALVMLGNYSCSPWTCPTLGGWWVEFTHTLMVNELWKDPPIFNGKTHYFFGYFKSLC